MFSYKKKLSEKKEELQMIDMHCEEPWFSLIQQKKKPVEGRKGSKKWRALCASDILRFWCDTRSFLARIDRVISYASVEEYLEDVGVDLALPGVSSVHEGARIYRQWNRPEEIQQTGFLAIYVTPLEQSTRKNLPASLHLE